MDRLPVEAWEGSVKMMVVGSLVAGPETETPTRRKRFAKIARGFGSDVAHAGHTLVVCSPYEGTADIEALKGLNTSHGAGTTKVEFHYPDRADILDNIKGICSKLGVRGVQLLSYPAIMTNGDLDRTNSWLLAQLKAMQECHGLVAIGGNVAGASSLFLLLAESNLDKAILPLPGCGGTAAESFERLRYPLQRMLGDRFRELQDPEHSTSAVSLVEALAEAIVRGPRGTRTAAKANRYFISYSRARPEAADFVEMTLRRRKCWVFRDDHSFLAGSDLPSTIRESIHGATVFVVLWCREYACSPHCYDEFALALDQHAKGSLQIVILCLDDTRMVPPRARPLLYYECSTRPALEARLNEQIDRLEHGARVE
jgi:hypothetical protein